MLPNKTGTDGSLVVPLTRRWHESAAALPANDKLGTVYRPIITRSVEAVPIPVKMETTPTGAMLNKRPTALNAMDFMKGSVL